MSTEKKAHKSGFVNIVGHPNVGKSTLMNALVGERMSIITNKPQTTRHRILGIVSEEDFQIVFSDTPGLIQDPSYKMQERMNEYVKSTLEDSDLMLLVADATEKISDESTIFELLAKLKAPVFLLLNKIDLLPPKEQLEQLAAWSKKLDFAELIPISALNRINTDLVLEKVIERMPEGPTYYPKEQFTDRPERFFMSEIIREKILLNYHQEIPYSVEVVVEAFQEEENITRILANIYVARKTQKAILIGKGGQAIKRLGQDARLAIQAFLETKVYLELHVKIKDNWRDDERSLNYFGYTS
ncbi:GTP-binding protein Era [Saprospira grandis DSM 2844]|uniref:GTPase Era n=1 Tax=Saprospira grandis DSM 2844 TaxID=694433 RepID=J0P5N8_9BACT|nr:GTPase Era [Saprospira grandis]EJF52757.1 GTP-binding protein Era [Saprospira grandis DSM 2844]